MRTSTARVRNRRNGLSAPWDIYDVAIRCHLQPVFGRVILCDIDTRAIGAYQAQRKKQKAGMRTLNKELQVLRQILKHYKLWAALQGDVKFEREHTNIGKALAPEEETKLLAACESNALLHTVVSLALNTALRKNEIRTLRWSQIDLFKRTLTVGRAKTEGGSGRVIPLNSVAYGALVRWAGGSPRPSRRIMSCRPVKTPALTRNTPTRPTLTRSRPINSWRTAWRRALKGCWATDSVPRSAPLLHYQARGEPSKRTDHHGYCGTPESDDGGALQPYPNGSETGGARRHRKAGTDCRFSGRCEPKRAPTVQTRILVPF